MHEYEVDWRPFEMKIYPGTMSSKKKTSPKTDWKLIWAFAFAGLIAGYILGLLQAATW